MEYRSKQQKRGYVNVYTERTLLISGSDKGIDAIVNFLKGCGYASVSVVSSGDEARRMLQHDTFGLIVLNTPLKDEFGYQLSLQLTQNTCSGVVMLCKSDMAEEMSNKTVSYGVLVVSKPLNRSALYQAVRMANAMNGRMMHMKLENDKLQKKLEELRCVSRAKCLLIEREQYTEEQAHRYIEKLAMDTRRNRKEVAMEILSRYASG